MKITYLGHSCFFLEGEKSLVTDPFSGIGYELKRVKADYVLSSHDHFDHNAIGLVDYGVAIKSPDDIQTAKDISLRAISSYHDNRSGSLRGINYIYRFTLDNITFTHLGDLGEDYSDKIVEAIGETDVLFVPVGGKYTVDGKTAAKYVKAINPKITIPMHYKTKRSSIDISDNGDFLREFTDIKYQPTSIMLEKADLTAKNTVYVFDTENY